MKLLTLTLILIFVALPAREMQADDRILKLEKRIIELELRVAKLERMLTSPQPESPARIKPGSYHNKANWRRLKLGMTKAQVTSILGDPPRRRVFPPGFDYW